MSSSLSATFTLATWGSASTSTLASKWACSKRTTHRFGEYMPASEALGKRLMIEIDPNKSFTFMIRAGMANLSSLSSTITTWVTRSTKSWSVESSSRASWSQGSVSGEERWLELWLWHCWPKWASCSSKLKQSKSMEPIRESSHFHLARAGEKLTTSRSGRLSVLN